MKKILTVLVAGIILWGILPGPVKATEHPVAVELRGNVVKGSNTPIDYYPSYAFIFDFGAPVDLGLAAGTPPGDGEESIFEVSLPVSLKTWTWGTEMDKSLELELYPTTNIKQGTSLRDRSIALGVIYDAGLVEDMSTVFRVVWHNYKLEGMTEDVTDWAGQIALRIDTDIF